MVVIRRHSADRPVGNLWWPVAITVWSAGRSVPTRSAN